MSARRKALITGITGQDGSYLAELLLEKGYDVHGMIRRSSNLEKTRLDHISKNQSLALHYGDLSDGGNIEKLLKKIQPDEVYHLAAQSHVRVSFDIPEYTADITGLGTLRLLEAIRNLELPAKFYNAASSEMFGNIDTLPATEETAFHPASPYAISKLFSYWTTVNYRESYGIFAVNGILFNHESPRRGKAFVTRKIVCGFADMGKNPDSVILLGNLDAKRDWGYAPEYVEGMWRMLQADTPDDYILATNDARSVREFTEEAARCFGYEIVWSGSGVDEIGTEKTSGKVLVRIDPKYFRPTEVNIVWGDASKAKRLLGWEPKITFTELVRLMAEAEKESL
jgi:GDPmannose 4,6-dehydratase